MNSTFDEKTRAGVPGVGLVAAAAELAASLEEWRDRSADADKTPMIRAVYVLLRKLMPHASRPTVDAIAELMVLELVRDRLASEPVPDEGCLGDASSAGARIVDVRAMTNALGPVGKG